MVEATANQVAYFEKVFDVSSELSPYDQVWQWKELLGVVALIAALVAVVPAAQLLLQSAWFNGLVAEIPEPLPAPQGRGRVVFWSVFTVGALVACFR